MKKIKPIIHIIISFIIICQTLAIDRSLVLGQGTQGPLPIAYYSGTSTQDNIQDLTTTKLEPNGTIYIHFDSAVTVTGTDMTLAKLYRIPKMSQQNFDDGTGRMIDWEYSFRPYENKIVPEAIATAGLGYDYIEKPEGTDQLTVSNISVLTSDTTYLCVKPHDTLDYRAKYRLVIDKSLVKGADGYPLASDLDFTFWTASNTQSQTINWKVDGVAAENLSENTDLGYKSYSEANAPVYGPTNPIVLNIDQEVIPKAVDSVLQSEPSKITSISFDSFKDITLVDMLNESSDTAKISIAKVLLRTYTEDNVKKSKLMLYPASATRNGNPYRLTIPETVLETRAANSVPKVEVRLYTQTDLTQTKGITSISPLEAKVTDFYWENGSFLIQGYNFNQNIDKVTLTRLNSATTVDAVYITGSDIVYIDQNSIKALVRGDAANVLSQESNVGQYGLALHFNDGSTTYEDVTWTGTPINIVSKERPVAVGRTPDPNNTSVWYDDSSLQYVIVTFEDIDGKITMKDFEAIRNCTIYAQGSELNLLNTQVIDDMEGLTASEKMNKLLIKDRTAKTAALYIPIKTLKPQTRYDVTIAPNIVGFSDISGSDNLNLSIQWSFTTMGIPAVTGMLTGTVVEDYDVDEPIYIKGSTFYDKVTVYFNDIEAEEVTVVQNSETLQSYLEVYLPKGDDKLGPGLYDITIKNDKNHTTIIYGGLSVVPEGEYIPNEEYKVKDDIRQGQIRSNLKVSEDTLMLDSEYANRGSLEFDLDKLMGENVLVRKIQFRGKSGDKIGSLSTKSKWADITFTNIGLHSDSSDRQITLSVGRVEPQLAQDIKQKLRGRSIKSELIQATGKNFSAEGITLVIPYRESDGKSLKVLRYDEDLRNFYGEDIEVNYADRTVQVNSERTGIFIVVE